MRTRERQLWLGFIEQAIGALALTAVAVARSPSTDFWPNVAMLVVAYVSGIVGATAIVDRRVPFVSPRRPEAGPEVDVPIGILLAAGAVVFVVLIGAFDWDTWPPSVRMFAAVITSTAGGTIGWGIAASGVTMAVARPLGRMRMRKGI